MAETILIPVAKQILGKLGDLALEQVGLLWTLKREILKLKDIVSTIQAVLLDAEEKQTHNCQVKDWLEKLSDVMHDADDLLDDFSTEAQADCRRRRSPTTTCWSTVCFLFSSLPKQLIYALKMAHDIKAIREKLDDITKDKDNLHLEVRTKEDALPLRETYSCPPTIIVGRENDKKNIIQLLLNTDCQTNISAVPIAGIGGLGKTTLAQLVFHDDQVKAHFAIKVWVHVS
ncbi:Putative disease resistance protein RGA3 [Linum grandiflorum]